MPYPHKYKHGKQEDVQEQSWFEEKMRQAEAMGETLPHLAYLTALWYSGVRKSELYERRLDKHAHGSLEVDGDVTLTEKVVRVDFGIDYGYWQGCRKKHGAKVPPLEVPRSWFGVEDWLVPHVFARLDARPPHKWSRKLIRYEEDTGKTTDKTYRLRSGETVTRTVPLLRWRKEQVRAVWLFPRISNKTSWDLVKRVFGEQYYPHYMRLRKLSAVGGNPETASYVHLKSLSGIKSTRAMEAYLGVSKRAQKQAMQVQ